MKHKIMSLLLVLALLAGSVLSVSAESYDLTDSGWYVRFTAGKKMESNFTTGPIHDLISTMQPGDDVTFVIALENKYTSEEDWYMRNNVLRSMEDATSAQYGAYSYKLTYTDPYNVPHELYNSETVGGEKSYTSGLHEATTALKDFFYLDTLPSGSTAYVELKVKLEGETQGNNYQNTLADLDMQFAVEGTGPNIPKTGDIMNMIPYLIASAVSGIVLLCVAIYSLKKTKRSAKH